MPTADQLPRPPRLREVAEPTELAFGTPPPPPRKSQRTALGQVLLVSLLPSLLPPAILALVMFLVGASSQTVIMSAALGGSLGISVIVTTLLSRRDETARLAAEEHDYRTQRAQFDAAFKAKVADGDRLVAREARILSRNFPAPAEIAPRVAALGPSLWERRPDDPDFLELRLGTGRRQTCLHFRDSAGTFTDGSLRQAVDRLSYHATAPVTAPLDEGVHAGLCGRNDAVDGLLGWLVFQAAAAHAPDELGIAVFSRNENLCGWAKWLPHCRIASPRDSIPLIGRIGTEASQALRAIANDLNMRGAAAGGRRYLVFADEREWDSLAERLHRRLPGDAKNVSVVRVQDGQEQLAGECTLVIDLSGNEGVVRRSVENNDPQTFVPDSLSPVDALPAAIALSPVSSSGGAGGTAIPNTARLADLLGDGAIDARGVLDTWDRTRHAFRLAAPIGVGPGDVPVEIDLRRDGPHALLAGTTGSGKSEFLQSLVVSLASKIPPDLLNFLLFDYKGGAAFAEVAALPHVVPMVTDLDERLAARALASLRAELKRREQLLASERAVNIIEYQSRARKVPLANLVIIIDEFHRLVSEQPEFIDQMVQIAQQGRSSGIHLILSTQKPSGVVSDHIRANTALRICLRVTDEADSRDVLGTPEAAHIPRDLPGRAYIRVGNEPLKACQAARVSGKVPSRREDTARVEADLFFPPARPRAIRKSGLIAWAVPRAPEADEDDRQADVELVDERTLIVEAICAAATQGRYPVQEAPWQPHLEEQLPLDELDTRPRAGGPDRIPIGLLDAPEEQRQEPFTISLDDGHILIAGAGNTGKTTALLTIASAACHRLGPDQLHVYGVDFGGGGLAPLDALPNSGGVAPQHDHPCVRWVIQALKDLLDDRVAARATNTSGAEARMLVMIDNFPGFASAVQDFEGGDNALDDLTEVMDVGRSVGITFALTTERPEALRTNISALMTTRLVFPLATPESYSMMGIPRNLQAAEPIPGRALLPGHVVHEVQLAIDGGFDGWDHQPPQPVPGGPLRIAPLPAVVTRESLASQSDRRTLLIGLREGTRPLFRFPRGEHMAIIGPRQSGRSNTLAVLIDELRAPGGGELFVVNPRRSVALKTRAKSVTRYAETAEDAEALWRDLAAGIEERSRQFASGGLDGLTPLAVIIDDLDTLEIPFDANASLERAVLRGQDVGVTIFASANSLALRATYPSGLTKALLNLRAGLLLTPQTVDDFDLLAVRGRPSRMGPGRGYWCEGGTRHGVQVALASKAVPGTAK